MRRSTIIIAVGMLPLLGSALYLLLLFWQQEGGKPVPPRIKERFAGGRCTVHDRDLVRHVVDNHFSMTISYEAGFHEVWETEFPHGHWFPWLADEEYDKVAVGACPDCLQAYREHLARLHKARAGAGTPGP